MKSFFAIGFASIYGLLIRTVFGFAGELMWIMSVAFLVLGPLIIGFLTVILVSKKKYISNTSAFFRPWITTLIILGITIVFKLEGSICWILMYPLFSILAGMGGIIANRFRKEKFEITDAENHDYWTKPDKLKFSFIAIVPLLFGLLEGDQLLGRKDITVSREIILDNDPADVWQTLLKMDSVDHGTKNYSLTSIIGFPSHEKTYLDKADVGGKRVAAYSKGLTFDETIVEYKENEFMRLKIDIDPEKISPDVMDEHIVLGGKYVNVIEDSYQLEILKNRKCKLKLTSHFYINTPFNWYAGIWANILMNDVLDGELSSVKARLSK